MGRCPKGGGAKAARPTFDAARHAVEGRPTIPTPGHDPSNARASVTQVGPRIRGAPTRHRAGVGRSIPRDPFLHSARPRAFHRRGGRGAPSPWRHARTRHSLGARRQSRPRPQGKGCLRSLPRASAHHTEADANEHGLRAAQPREASASARRHRSAQLGSTFFGLGPSPGGHDRTGSDGCARDVDGNHRLAARRRSPQARGTSVRLPTATPNLDSADVASGAVALIPRMSHPRRL
jgi:hypothetical protein